MPAPKCVVCDNTVADGENDLCDDCQDFKDGLIKAACSKRRALITGNLVYYNFNIVDLDENRECLIKCGFCCRTGWATVLSLRYKFGENDDGKPCPHLKDTGCELSREKRPNGCIAFLCPIAWHVQAKRMTIGEAKLLLGRCGGDSEIAAAKLQKRRKHGTPDNQTAEP